MRRLDSSSQRESLAAILGAAKRLRLALVGYDPADDMTLPRMILAVRQMQAALSQKNIRSKAAMKLGIAVKLMLASWPVCETGIIQGALPTIPDTVEELVDTAVTLLSEMAERSKYGEETAPG